MAKHASKQATRPVDEALIELYFAGTTFLDEYPWEFEHDRWRELLVCVLISSGRVDPTRVRDMLDLVDKLKMTSCSTLAAAGEEQVAFLHRVFLQMDLAESDAEQVVLLLITTAKAVQANWEGRIQRLLRKHAMAMVAELSSQFEEAGIPAAVARGAATQWLQNVGNLPLLSENDANVKAFCKVQGTTYSELIESADRLGLNVSVLDDLLAVEASAGAVPVETSGRSKKARSIA